MGRVQLKLYSKFDILKYIFEFEFPEHFSEFFFHNILSDFIL